MPKRHLLLVPLDRGQSDFIETVEATCYTRLLRACRTIQRSKRATLHSWSEDRREVERIMASRSANRDSTVLSSPRSGERDDRFITHQPAEPIYLEVPWHPPKINWLYD